MTQGPSKKTIYTCDGCQFMGVNKDGAFPTCTYKGHKGSMIYLRVSLETPPDCKLLLKQIRKDKLEKLR